MVVILLLLVAAFGPWLMPHDPIAQNLALKRTPPGPEYLLGTDEFGRDILSRVILGARYTLLVPSVAVTIGLILGGSIGLIAGFAGGWWDDTLMRVMEVLLAFPYLLLAIAIVATLGPGQANTVLAIGIGAIPGYARLIRGQILSLREREFVLAARSLGAPADRILLRHLVPNTVAPVIVYMMLSMAGAILLEAALSFLGLGVQPPRASWGLMVATGRDFLHVAPHVATVPGLAIMLAVLGFNLLGDGLRDALDPRLRGRL
jgi:peptide/nickel transport system permease protein